MNNNEATLSGASLASSIHHADQFSVTTGFYDRIRSRFLQQSARYLRDSLDRKQAGSHSGHHSPVHS